MNGFLFDENLPTKILFIPTLPIVHVSLVQSTDAEVKRFQ
jgi:hypothetical protein